MSDLLTNCKICNLAQKEMDVYEELTNQGASSYVVSKQLKEIFDVKLSDSSVRRHRLNHKNSKPTPRDDSERKGSPEVESTNSLGSVTLTSTGGEFKDIQTEEPLQEDWSEIFLRFKLDPEKFEIVNDTVKMSSWQQSKRLENGDRDVQTLYSYKASFRKKVKIVNEIDLPTLVATIRDRVSDIKIGQTTGDWDDDLGVVTCFSDLQAGKTDHRGGTPELLNRVYDVLEKYEEYLIKNRPSTVVLTDLGDIVEGFNSTASEMFTNDLSIMDQVDLAHTVVSEFLSISATYAKKVIAVAVPSNHGAWRKGKDYLGTPADDWGLHIFRMIEKEYSKYGLDDNIKFVYPNQYDKSVNVTLKDTNIGFVHGDDWSGGMNGSETWWQKQQHGGGPTSRSDILVHGHFHTFGVRMSGRTPEGLQKWIISATTLDSGSSWFANGFGGGDSEAGLTVFGVRRGIGLDLSTLRVLK